MKDTFTIYKIAGDMALEEVHNVILHSNGKCYVPINGSNELYLTNIWHKTVEEACNRMFDKLRIEETILQWNRQEIHRILNKWG